MVDRIPDDPQVAARLPGAPSVRAERLLKITSAIANAVSPSEVYDAVVDQAAEAIGASSAGLWLLDDVGETAKLAHSRGYAEVATQKLAVLPLDMTPCIPALDVIRRAEPIWIPSQAALLEQYPHLRPVVTAARSYRISCLPLITHGRVVGSLAFTVERPGEAHEEERNFLLLVAGYATQAIERLRLLESERRSRDEAKAALKRLEILSQASRAFVASALDRDSRLHRVVSELSSVLDSCINLSLLGPDGKLHLVAVQHPNTHAHDRLRSPVATAPLRVGEGVTGTIAATGQSVLLPKIDPDLIRKRAAAPYRGFLEKFPAYAMVGAALKVRDSIIGTVTATRCREGESYTEEDLRLLEDLADRAAVALENSRLYQEAIDARGRAERLYDFAQAIVAADQLDAVFAAAADAIEAVLGTNRSAILTFDEDGPMKFRAWRNISERYRRAVEGHSPWPREAVAPEPVLVPDVNDAPALKSFQPLFRAEGIGALAFIPLVSSGRLLGKFMVYFDHEHAFLEREIEMALAIASHLASVINRFAAVARLEDTLRCNELFAGILAHDLRNPLGAMMMAAQLVMESAPDEQAIKPLHRVITSGQRMTRMIDQLLDFTRARLGGQMPLEKQKIDLCQLAKQTIDEIELAAPGVTIALNSVGNLEGSWDNDRMAQVFSNLAGNAAQHGLPEQPIRFQLDGRKAHSVEIAIHNRGAIPRDILPQLFEPFRSTQHKRDGSHGLGLGLYITQQVVRAHGGEISVTSSAEDGTTFNINLPRDSSSALALSEAPPWGHHQEQASLTNEEASMTTEERSRSTTPQVLVVDDDIDVRDAMEDLLIDKGFSVLTASNGAEALKLLRSLTTPPLIILLDVMMPVMDGYGFLEQRRADPSLAPIPVAVVSAGHGVDHERLGDSVQVLPKPINVPKLMATIQAIQKSATAS